MILSECLDLHHFFVEFGLLQSHLVVDKTINIEIESISLIGIP